MGVNVNELLFYPCVTLALFQYCEGTIDENVLPASAKFSTNFKLNTIGPNQTTRFIERVPMCQIDFFGLYSVFQMQTTDTLKNPLLFVLFKNES